MHQTSLDFEDAQWLKLSAYLKATGALMSRFIRDAINERIDAELSQNAGVKARYEKISAQLLVEAGGNIAMIGQRRKPKKATPTAEPTATAK